MHTKKKKTVTALFLILGSTLPQPARAGFSSCDGTETRSIVSCQSDCDPAITDDTENELPSCVAWQCHMYCSKHADGISQTCLNKQREECRRYTDSEHLDCQLVDCSGAWATVGAWLGVWALTKLLVP